MKVVLKKFTFRDFMLFNDENEKIYELIYGSLIKMPPPIYKKFDKSIEVYVLNEKEVLT